MAAKVPTKRIKREIRTLRKGLIAEKKKSIKLTKGIAAVRKRTAKTAKTAAAKTANLANEMERLKNNIGRLAKKKTPKKQLSEYNLFMRRQLNAGKTFSQAVRLWNAYRRGRSVARNRAVRKIVAGPRVVTRVRTVIRRVPVIRTIVKRVPVTRTVVKAIRPPYPDGASEKMVKELHSSLSYMASEINSGMQELKRAVRDSPGAGFVPRQDSEVAPGDERVAIELLSVFFQEVHRLGLKRRLELDDVLNSYFDILAKIKERKAIAPIAPAAVTASSKDLSSHN